MAKSGLACWDSDFRAWFRGATAAAAVLLAPSPFPCVAADGPALAASRPGVGAMAVLPRAQGRLSATDLGLVVNTNDPYSVEVGAFYADVRHLAPEQILRVAVPVKPSLTPEEFRTLKSAIDDHFGDRIQALALAWAEPYAVQCNGITGAIGLGYDAALCSRTCAPSRWSRYFNAATARPYTDMRMRPAMLLAAPDVAAAKALIERGVTSDHSLGLRGAPPVHAWFLSTPDAARNVRAPLFPPPGPLRGAGVTVHVEAASGLPDAGRVVLLQTGSARVHHMERIDWVPGALADHLTSFGGVLGAGNGQTSAMAWIAAGATASYGTVSEPCSHPQKFPHPQALLLHYVQGSTAIEAYWKSVAWPQQGVFIGEPLAAPFARP